MRRVAAAALLVVFAGAGAAGAQGFTAWSAGVAAAEIGGDPWPSDAGFVADDAFVFADASRSAALDADAIAVATRADMKRMTDPVGAARQRATPGPDSRVAAAFARFTAIGVDGRAYASLETAGERPGPATTVREVALAPAVLAMMLPLR